MEKLLSSFDSSSNEEKLPTLKQWLKSQGKKEIQLVHEVVIVWKPNQYPNITFQTEQFVARLNVSKESMSEHVQLLRRWFMNDLPIAIELAPECDGNFDVALLETNKCEWTELGTNGYKIEWKKRDSAKPESKNSDKPTKAST